MVRAWHWDIVPILDDNRLPAAHAELHYIMAALRRGTGMFWKHPETQKFYGCEAVLRYLHNQTVDVMDIRGYKHNSPLDGPAVHPENTTVFAAMSATWYQQDLADLYRKWTMEGRITQEEGCYPAYHTGGIIYKDDLDAPHPPLGYLKGGKAVYGFRKPRGPILSHSLADKMRLAAETHPPRVWDDSGRVPLHALMEAEHRGPSTDPWNQ